MKTAQLDCHRTKLTGEQRAAVLRLLSDGLTVRAVSIRFGISPTTIRRIKQAHRPASPPRIASVRKARPRFRSISPLRVQWLFHLADISREDRLTLDELAQHFNVSRDVIKEALAGRKRLVLSSVAHAARPGGWEKYLFGKESE